MIRLFSDQGLNDEVMDNILEAKGKPLDGDADKSGVTAVAFDGDTIVFSIANIHPVFAQLQSLLSKHFLMFKTTNELFLPFEGINFDGEKVREFFKGALSCIRIGMCFGSGHKLTAYGSWSVPADGATPKSDPFDFLRTIEASEIGLLEAMDGNEYCQGFELSLDTIRFRKKGEVRDVAPRLWVDQVLRDPSSNEVFARLNILSRAGKKYRVVSEVIKNTQLQDVKLLTEWVVSVATSVVDRKSLAQFMPNLLRAAFNKFEARTWIRAEGWHRNSKGEIEACAVGKKLYVADNTNTEKFFVDITSPALVQVGTLDEWNALVLGPASGNYIMIGALQLGLAACMVDFLPGVSSGTFNFFGGAGRGKTLLLSTVASLFGNTAAPGQSATGRVGKTIIETFGSTQRALQAKGQQTPLGALFIDEVGSNTYGELDSFAYEMGNGSCRTRLGSSGSIQESPPKTLFILTSAEQPLIHMISKNARQGVLDRAVDINIGGGDVTFDGQDDEDFYFLPETIKRELSLGIQTQYGTAVPAFIEALFAERDSQDWMTELEGLVLDILSILPSYVAREGAKRVVVRFALAALAGKVARRNNVFMHDQVSEETLMGGVYICSMLWSTTRWNHLLKLKEYFLSKKRIPLSGPSARLGLYRHQTIIDDFPTLMISKECLEDIFPDDKAEIIGKRLREDGHLVRFDSGRNTVGKIPYYHLRVSWLLEHNVVWCDESERFIESDDSSENS